MDFLTHFRATCFFICLIKFKSLSVKLSTLCAIFHITELKKNFVIVLGGGAVMTMVVHALNLMQKRVFFSRFIELKRSSLGS